MELGSCVHAVRDMCSWGGLAIVWTRWFTESTCEHSIVAVGAIPVERGEHSTAQYTRPVECLRVGV